MKVDTKQRKKARKGFAQVYGDEELAARMVHVLQIGKKGLDSLVMELGRMLAETIMDMEREERSGPEGKPLHPGVYKWAYQKGSIYCGDQKISVNHPRLRGPEGEIALSTYETLKQRGAFSEELLARSPSRHIGQTIRRDRHRYRIRLRRLCLPPSPATSSRPRATEAQGVQGKGPFRYLRLCRLHRHGPPGQGSLHGCPGDRRPGP